jgi:hypothetical protein
MCVILWAADPYGGAGGHLKYCLGLASVVFGDVTWVLDCWLIRVQFSGVGLCIGIV